MYNLKKRIFEAFNPRQNPVDGEGKEREEQDKSRRGFIKTIGAGAAVAGAYAALPSTTAFSITSDSSIDFYNSSSQSSNMQIGTSGDLDLKNSDVVNAKNVEAENLDFSDDTGTKKKSIKYDKELDTLVVVDHE